MTPTLSEIMELINYGKSIGLIELAVGDVRVIYGVNHQAPADTTPQAPISQAELDARLLFMSSN